MLVWFAYGYTASISMGGGVLPARPHASLHLATLFGQATGCYPMAGVSYPL